MYQLGSDQFSKTYAMPVSPNWSRLQARDNEKDPDMWP